MESMGVYGSLWSFNAYWRGRKEIISQSHMVIGVKRLDALWVTHFLNNLIAEPSRETVNQEGLVMRKYEKCIFL
jgi:hypothetical protein